MEKRSIWRQIFRFAGPVIAILFVVAFAIACGSSWDP